jgi:hypothetical protein
VYESYLAPLGRNSNGNIMFDRDDWIVSEAHPRSERTEGGVVRCVP